MFCLTFLLLAITGLSLAEPMPRGPGNMILYEGNSATQNIVCILDWPASDFFLNFKDDADCQNDEARSAKLMVGTAGTIITVYDDPAGAHDDDYTVIKIKKDITYPIIINSFEENFVDPEGFIDVTYHPINGLDGKVSRFEKTEFRKKTKL